MVQVVAWRSALEWWKKLSWRSLRFPVLFLVSVALLTLMYRLRSDRIDKEEAEKALLVTKAAILTAPVLETKKGRRPGGQHSMWPDEADLSEVHERWVVVSGTEEGGGGGGRRPQGGAEAACSLAAAAKAKGWRPIVIGEELKCCRLPDCVPLDSALLSRLPYRVLLHASSPPPPPRQSTFRPSPLRNAAYLFAIQHGARFVFDAYPPQGDNGSLTSWADEVFSSMALGTSVGLVLDGYSYSFPTSVPGAPAPRVLNPYAHFGRPDLWPRGYEIRGGVVGGDQHHYDGQHLRYRVCEIRQPSVEMFLDVWDGGPADLVAPPVTVPISVLAPYASRNVLYTRDAFWGLALLPARKTTNGTSTPDISPHLARSLWNHALLGATSDSGGVRFSLVPGTEGRIHSNRSNSVLSRVSLEEEMTVDTSAYIATFTSHVLRWRCRCTTLLPCLSQLASDFLATSLLTPEDAAFLEAWVTDLRRVRYLPPPTLPWAPRPPPRPPGPCIHPPHHHHRQSHDPPLPHPTTLTFHPVHFARSTALAAPAPSSIKKLIARFHRDAALLEWSSSHERTREEVSLVEETLIEDRLLLPGADVIADVIADVPSTSQSIKAREDNLSRKVMEVTVVSEGEGAGEDEATIQEEESTEKTGEESEDSTDVPRSNQEEFIPPLARSFLGDIAEHICPGFSPLASSTLPHIPPLSSTALENVLLVVWFPRPPRYDLLPTLELLRLRHFPNALFCGPPHRALPAMLSRFDGRNSPSFLTATSRSDCLLTALEMGYRVGEEGSVLLVEESALPVPWNLAQRNRSLVWFHAEKMGDREKRSPDMRGRDGNSGDNSQKAGQWKMFHRVQEESVIMAAEGLASSLRFMARLMGVRPNPHLHPHHHPLEETDHEDNNWGRTPVNATSATNNTESSTPPINETSHSSLDIIEYSTELTTGVYNENHTSELTQVDGVSVPTVEDGTFASVQHIDTPSVEYSEPTIVEYSEPKLLDSDKTREVAEITEPIQDHGNDSHSLESLDTPSVRYHEPTSVSNLGLLEVDGVRVETVSDHGFMEQYKDNVTEALGEKLDTVDTVTMQGEHIWAKDGINATFTEWPTSENTSVIPRNDSNRMFEPPSNPTSSDWEMSSDAEEILSSVTMIENAPENNTEGPDDDDDDIVTEYLVGNYGLNVSLQPTEETRNATLQQAFEMKYSELYEEDKDKEDPVGDGEQSLVEQDTLLSYKDVEDSPQFINLPSAVSKSHSKPIKEPVGISVSTEAEARKKRDTVYAEGVGQYSVDSAREQSKKSKESVEDDSDGMRTSVISPRLSRSLHEIEELFSELASEFPEDTDAVLKERGNPDIMRYPTKHYGLDHTDFRHLHCDYGEEEEDVKDGNRDWGDPENPHFEPCTVLRRFFLRLYFSHQSTTSMLNLLSLAITRGSAPIFHLPMRLQRELHLTASLLLSQGFPEEAVLPLLVYGLAGENGWVNLERGSFVDNAGAFPEFDEKANFIHPTNLREVPEEPRLRSVFCLKFLLRILDG